MTKRMMSCAVMSVVALSACGGPECTKDADCGGASVCQRSVCVAGSAGGGTSFGVGGFGGGTTSAAGGGSSAGGRAGGGSASAGGSATGGGSGVSTCPSGSTVLVPGSAVMLQSTNNGGNPPREFCFVVPASASRIELVLDGGSCAPYSCIGDDVELYLKRDAAPDPFSPDTATKKWVFTPGGMGLKGTSATPGVWFLTQITSANTLGFRNVSLTLALP